MAKKKATNRSPARSTEPMYRDIRAVLEPEQFIRDPYVLEFLDLKDYPALRESAIEQAIIDNLQGFLPELGKGFSFVVRLFDDQFTSKGDNPTIGLVLCAEKNEAVARYSVLNESKQIFAANYLKYLPTEAELQREIERERRLIDAQHTMKEDR